MQKSAPSTPAADFRTVVSGTRQAEELRAHAFGNGVLDESSPREDDAAAGQPVGECSGRRPRRRQQIVERWSLGRGRRRSCARTPSVRRVGRVLALEKMTPVENVFQNAEVDAPDAGAHAAGDGTWNDQRAASRAPLGTEFRP